MKFLSAQTMVTTGVSIDGGYMSSGPYKGLWWTGSIVVDVPINGHYEAIPDTVDFSQSPKVFGNLGDCSHFKIAGTAYSPSNNGPVGPPSKPSVFGPTYSQEGVGSCIIARTSGSRESYVCLPGDYNDLYEFGEWCFGLAARRVGNHVEVVWGNVDHVDDRYIHKGYYEFLVQEWDSVNGNVFTRSTGVRRPVKIRTQDMRPFEALEECKEEVYSFLPKAEWNVHKKVNSMYSISIPRIACLSPDQIFPKQDARIDWGELAADAYDSVPFFKSNGIAYTKDIIDLRKNAVSTLNLLTSSFKAGKLATKAANLFLSFYYGWRLMYKDTEEAVNAYRKSASLRSNRCKATSRRTWESHGATYVATLQCYYNRYAKANSLDRFILDNDLTLTPENLWDLVPFSFVVDWFTNIGSVLEDASNYYNFTQKHEVVCTGRSIKATKIVSARQLSSRYAGEIIITNYNRWYTSGPINPTFRFGNSVNPLDHAIEGTALIVSRR